MERSKNFDRCKNVEREDVKIFLLQVDDGLSKLNGAGAQGVVGEQNIIPVNREICLDVIAPRRILHGQKSVLLKTAYETNLRPMDTDV